MTSIKYFLLVLLTGCFFACIKLAAGTPQDLPRVTYRTTVDEVRLTFFTTDEAGHASTDLNSNDFVVVDDALVVRSFRSFTRLIVNGLRVIILVDTSASVAGQFQNELNSVLELIDRARWMEEDKVSVVAFGRTPPKLMCSGDCRSNLAWVRTLPERNGGITPLFDAVVFAADIAAQHQAPDIMTVLILFSDGEDTISFHSFADAVGATATAESQIYSVEVKAPRQPRRGTAVLQELAWATGGRFFGMGGAVEGLLTALLNDLQAAYMLTYQPPSSAPGHHSVRILPARNPSLQFRSRRGYDYEAPTRDQRGAP